MSQKYIYSLGKRKTASVQIHLFEWKWESLINEKQVGTYITRSDLFEIAFRPLKLCKVFDGVYFHAIAQGGWESSQAAAIAHGISRALASQDEGHKKVLKAAGLLTRDARKVERKKPGLKKARKSPSWSKR